jgi:hypothetical protein
MPLVDCHTKFRAVELDGLRYQSVSAEATLDH